MTLQASGAISLSDIQTEFGGSNPISISEFYGVDSYPDTLPASGVISFSDFYGLSEFVGGLMADNAAWPRTVGASGAAGNRSTTTSVTLPAGTRSVFFAGATFDNGYELVSFSSITVDGNSCTRRANVTDGGEYTSNVGIWDYTFASALTADTTVNVVVNMSNSTSASGGASCWMFISEFAVTSANAATGTENGFNTSMNLYEKGLVIGVGQSGIGGGYTGGAFDTYVGNPYEGVDGSWGSYSRGYGYFIPPTTEAANVQVYADATDYAQAVAACSYQLS